MRNRIKDNYNEITDKEGCWEYLIKYYEWLDSKNVHAFPRYNKSINLFDIDWEDKEVRNTLVNFGSVETLNDNLLFKIRDYMK